ncbi:MAG: phage holin family protein [Bacilli bacterium]|nr:phage holin family protein [Bacilli bacterium]MCI9585313.1 phage holin family protein [Bacilli bacterium]
MKKNIFSKEFFYKLIDWAIKMVGYAAILMVTSLIFDDTLYIDNGYFGLWSLIAAVIIFLLNKTIKPFLVWLTIPITGITLGLFYPFINLIILKIVSLVLNPHFYINGIWFAVCASLLISILNVLMDTFVLDKIKGKVK